MTRERFVDSGDVRIHVVEQGPEDGAPVLFLHGFPEFWWSWRHQMDALADAGYRAVAMDLRGFGESDRPDGVDRYSMLESVGDVTAVLETLGGRAAIVCHDWGGSLGWVYTALFPDRIDRLAAMNAAHPSAFSSVSKGLAQLQASWYMFFFQFEGVAEEALSRNGYERLRAWFYDTASVPLPAADVDRYVEVFSRPGALTAGLNWYRANVPPASLVGEGGGGLPQVTRPTLVLWGVDDAYLTYEVGAMAGDFVAAPYAFQALPDTGHWIQQERPQEVNAHLIEFLGAHLG